MDMTVLERIRLLELLPDRGNNLDLKILRKLRESLSFSEDERGLMTTWNEYKCPFEERSSEGKVTRCERRDFSSGPIHCAEHNLEMQPTGRMSIVLTPEGMAAEKDIHMGPRAVALCTEGLKRLNDAKQLTEGPLESLYYKFFPEEAAE